MSHRRKFSLLHGQVQCPVFSRLSPGGNYNSTELVDREEVTTQPRVQVVSRRLLKETSRAAEVKDNLPQISPNDAPVQNLSKNAPILSETDEHGWGEIPGLSYSRLPTYMV